MRSALPGSARRSKSNASVGVRASVRYRKSTQATNSSGVNPLTSFQTGIPAWRAYKSHRALTIAASARWMTPLSGPIQRSCESPVKRRQTAPGAARNSSSVSPTTRCSWAMTAAQTTSLPRPMVKVDP